MDMVTRTAPLAHESHGTGHPLVLVHGLTFDRSSWQPIIEALDPSIRTIAIDMPAHGESAGPAASPEEVAGRLRHLLEDLQVAEPVIVGHSLGAAVAAIYTANHPSSGLVMIDSGPAVQSFAELTQRMVPQLLGAEFPEAWKTFESSLGLERIPEPAQSHVRAGHRVEQHVVLGYWHQMLTTAPADFQAWIDSAFAKIAVPVLAIFGSPAPDADRRRLEQLPDVRVEEYPGEGHFVHLIDPARTASSLHAFVTHCTEVSSR